MTAHFCEIRFREDAIPGARYVSGGTVYDEALSEGRLVTRYWNPNGQVWPEMHYRGRSWPHGEPADAFRLSIHGRDLSGGYVWESASLVSSSGLEVPRLRDRLDDEGRSRPAEYGVIELRHPEAGILVRVATRLDGDPFIVRWLEITNLNAIPVGITEVAPFAGNLWLHRYEEHLPAGAESPFELIYNHRFEWGREGDFWPEPIAKGRTVVDGGRKGRSGWGRPAFWVRDLCNGQTFVCELAWGGNYGFAVDFHTYEDSSGGPFYPYAVHGSLFFRMGLSGYDDVLRVLAPGETVATPAVHLALFHTDTDAIVQATHDHVRYVVLPEAMPGRHVEIEANHRGYLIDRENVPGILKDVDVARAVGAEMYVIDAGWFGKEPNQWWNNVGDWFEGPWMAEGGGLKAVADYAHAQGLKFGLWAEVEAAGANSALRKAHPEWLLRRDGVPIAEGRALDLTQPAVTAWVESEIERLIRTYELDMYRIDHNHVLQPSGNREIDGFTEDLMWRYYDALYGIIDRLRARFPDVVFQNCAGGGGRLDWGTLSRFHNTELSDWMRLPRGVKILNGVTMSLPPEILLRTFGTEVSEHVLDADVDTQLRHCFCRMIFRGIAPSLEELTPYLRDRIVQYVEVYKSKIRPIMTTGRVYHHTPFLPLAQAKADPRGAWCVMEYAYPDRSAAVAAVFRIGPVGNDAVYIFRPRGLAPDGRYRITLDGQGGTFEASGSDLVRDGVRVRLETVLSSELLLFEPGS